jgi:hypothetical protein
VSTDVLLARLARLDPHDRAWLLGELPVSTRRELLEMLADEGGAPAPAATPPDVWDALDPELVAQALESEPAWLVSAATGDASRSWRQRLLHALGPRRRHEMEIEDRAGRVLGPRARNLVLDACREHIAGAAGKRRPGEPGTRFAKLVERMRSRIA